MFLFLLLYTIFGNCENTNGKNYYCQCGNIGHSLITLPLNLKNLKNIDLDNLRIYVPSQHSKLRVAGATQFTYKFSNIKNDFKKILENNNLLFQNVIFENLENNAEYNNILNVITKNFKSKLWNTLNITEKTQTKQLNFLKKKCINAKTCLEIKIDREHNLNKQILDDIIKGTEDRIVKDKISDLLSCKFCLKDIINIPTDNDLKKNAYVSISDTFVSKYIKLVNLNDYNTNNVNIFSKSKNSINDLYVLYGNVESIYSLLDYLIAKYQISLNLLSSKRKFFTKYFSNIYNILNVSVIYNDQIMQSMFYDHERGETYENPYIEDVYPVLLDLKHNNIYPYSNMNISPDNTNIRVLFSKEVWNGEKIKQIREERRSKLKLKQQWLEKKLKQINSKMKRNIYWFSPWFVPKNRYSKNRSYNDRLKEIYNITQYIVENDYLNSAYFFTELDIVRELKNKLDKINLKNKVNIVLSKRVKFCEMFYLAELFINNLKTTIMNTNNNNKMSENNENNMEDYDIRVFANSDIYPSTMFFEKLLNDSRLLDNECAFSLTRWNVDKKIPKNNIVNVGREDFCNYNFDDIFFKHGSSQDVWVFSGKLKNNMLNCSFMGNFYFGIPGCDSAITAQLRDVAGYKRIINPSLKYKTCHEHTYGLRTYLGDPDVRTAQWHHMGLGPSN